MEELQKLIKLDMDKSVTSPFSNSQCTMHKPEYNIQYKSTVTGERHSVYKKNYNYHKWITYCAHVCKFKAARLEIAIPGSGILAVFANPESQDWQRLNPGTSGLQKLAKIVLFHVLNDRNKNK